LFYAGKSLFYGERWGMKIDKLELFTVPPRWLFLKITTDDGTFGWGEPIVEGKADTVRACVEEMADFLIGKEAGHIEDLWQVLYRGSFYRGGPVLTSAISGIEQALWDIKGKSLGVPVYELLGGPVREKVRVYAWIGGDDPAGVAEQAKLRVAEGYTAVKMNATGAVHWIDSPVHIQDAAARLQAVREAVGPDFGIGIDFHGRVHKGMAKALVKALEPFSPMFIEEPVLAENNEALLELSRHTTVPIATGERMFTRWHFKGLLTQGGVDILQPDISHTGGIWELRKIAAMAEAFDVAVAPHCPLGPITLAASLQLDFCTPNAFIQEQSLGIHYNQGSDLLDYLTDPTVFHYENGFVHRLTAPGLGIEIHEEKVREAAKVGHRWRNPVWRTEDGSVTEW
jgi:galactonate dehydratase